MSGRSHRHDTRKDYDMSVRVNLLEDDADSHEAEVASLNMMTSGRDGQCEWPIYLPVG